MGVRVIDFPRIKRLLARDPDLNEEIAGQILEESQPYLNDSPIDSAVPSNSEQTRDSWNARDNFDKWELMCMALMLWYEEQDAAAALIESLRKNSHPDIGRGRDPLRILTRQREYLSQLTDGRAEEKDLQIILDRWHKHQLTAANMLRLGLREPVVDLDKEQDSYYILDLQQRYVTTMERESTRLFKRLWVDESDAGDE